MNDSIRTNGTGTTEVINNRVYVTSDYESTLFQPIALSSTESWGTQIGSTKTLVDVIRKNSEGDISVNLYVKYVKSKFTKLQQEKLKVKINKLSKMVKASTYVGQKALYENLTKMLAIMVRELEAIVCGINKFVDIKDITRFTHKVKDRVIQFKKLEDFPRLIPRKIENKIKGYKDKKLFDEYWILYIDYTNEVLKTNKEKIREKDPILFGKYSYNPDTYYYLCDWVDEYCDLTLDKFVDKLKENDEDYELNKIAEMNQKMFDEIKEEVMERQNKLNDTKPSNFKKLMEEEDERHKKGLFSRIFKRKVKEKNK